VQTNQSETLSSSSLFVTVISIIVPSDQLTSHVGGIAGVFDEEAVLIQEVLNLVASLVLFFAAP
jgi:hypothetical protein